MNSLSLSELIACAITFFILGWRAHATLPKIRKKFKLKKKLKKNRKSGPAPRKFRNVPTQQVKIGDLTLTVRRDDLMTGYRRDYFGPALSSVTNGERISPRDKILKRDGRNVQIAFGAIVKGSWTCPYTGRNLTHPSQIQIDHVVPLAEAWRSGAQDWTSEKLVKFARDSENLVAVSTESNKAKSDKDISEWLPNYNKLNYIAQWLRIKSKYGLSLDNKEFEVVKAAAAE